MKPRVYLVSRSPHWLAAVQKAAAEDYQLVTIKCSLTDPQCLADLPEACATDLILIDPACELNVLDAVRTVRDLGRWHVVVIAAKPAWKQARNTLRAGGFDYWSMSYDPGTIRARLNRCLQELTHSLVPVSPEDATK